MLGDTISYLVYYKSFNQDKTCNIDAANKKEAIDIFNHHFKGCQFVDIKDNNDIANDISDSLMKIIQKSFDDTKNKTE